MERIIQLNAQGLHCPLPVLKAKKVLASMVVGQLLEVSATDEDSVRDFEAFTRSHGHLLLKSWQANGVFMFLIQKGETS